MDLRAIKPAIGRGIGNINSPMYGLKQDYPTSFFNGIDFTGSTYTGGPTYVPDHLEVLSSPGANLPACEGFRLATTVEDGAVLGPELEPYGHFSDGIGTWTAVNCTPVVGVDGVTCTVTGIYASLQKTKTYKTGCKYLISVEYDYGTVTANKLAISFGPGINFVIPGDGAGTYDFYITPTPSYTRLVVGALDNLLIGWVFRYVKISVKEVIPTYVPIDTSGNPIVTSTPQKTVTYSTDWTSKTLAETFNKFDISDPLKAPGWLCEPARTNYALNSAAPATLTTGTIAAGTYTLWQEGTGSIVATSGTAVGTFGTASNGSHATITITTGGTVVLTASGTNTFVQLELGTFKTSRIYTTTAAQTRAATVLTYPAVGKIKPNNMGLFFTLVPRASNQTSVIFNSQSDVNNRLTIYQYPEYIEAVAISNGLKVGGCIMMYTHQKDVPIQLALSKHSIDGMRISVREYSGGAWGNWINGGVSVMTSNLSLGTTYTLGSGLGYTFCGNISEFDCYILPSIVTNGLTWLKDKLGVATAIETSDPTIMTFTSTGVTSVLSTLQTSGTSADDTVTVVWGDGNSNTYASVSDIAANHTYPSSSNVYRVKIQGKDDGRLKKYYNNTSSLNISGALSMPSGLTYFHCGGSNTLSGTLSMPSTMTYFHCTGSNTLSGTLSMPSTLTYFYCGGSNTLSGYTTGTKANNQNRFYLVGLNTMSSSDVDNILIDYAAVSTWTGEKVFYLQGNASNRTSASDAAYATLQTKGLAALSVD